MLQNADLVFWVGEDIETFLEKPLKTVAVKARKIELMKISQLKKLKFRVRIVIYLFSHVGILLNFSIKRFL